jgi:hypothetical protein
MDRGQPNSNRRMRRPLLAPLLAILMLLAAAAVAQADTIDVNTTSDAPASPAECSGVADDCSLRQAIDKAQPGDSVQLGSGHYGLTLGSTIEIAKSLAIDGGGLNATSIDGSLNVANNAQNRILRVDDGAQVTIQDVTFTGGFDGNDEGCCGGSVFNLRGGGAIFNASGTLTLQNVAFSDNPGGHLGGAISNNGTLDMRDVSFTNDQADIGGALFSRGNVTATGVTFEKDATSATDEAAVYLLSGNASFTNTTVVGSGGASSRGGGIHNADAILTLTNDTLSNNIRGSLLTDRGATTKVANTIIADGFSDGDGDCVAPGLPSGDGTTAKAITTDLGGNLDQDNSCGLSGTSGDVPGKDPKLVPITDNGGPTRTEALLAGSPALGDPSTSSDCPTVDQRGTSRPDGKCDIGAFEAVLFASPTASTGGADGITDTTADLSATINLQGEAGGFHFLYSTSPDLAGATSSPEAAAGVPDRDTLETDTLDNLAPDTTYYYKAVADNATASTLAPTKGQFTTLPGPPVVSGATVASVTDTTATITFSIDPEGSDTTYFGLSRHECGQCHASPSACSSCGR